MHSVHVRRLVHKYLLHFPCQDMPVSRSQGCAVKYNHYLNLCSGDSYVARGFTALLRVLARSLYFELCFRF